MKLTGNQIFQINGALEALISLTTCNMLHLILQRTASTIGKEKKYLGITVDMMKKAGAEKDKTTKEIIYVKEPQWSEGKEIMVSQFTFKDQLKTIKEIDAFLDQEIEVNINQIKFETIEEAESKFNEGVKPILMALHGSLFSIKELTDLESKIK